MLLSLAVTLFLTFLGLKLLNFSRFLKVGLNFVRKCQVGGVQTEASISPKGTEMNADVDPEVQTDITTAHLLMSIITICTSRTIPELIPGQGR